MAAYYNCSRNGEAFSGIAFGCSIEWGILKASAVSLFRETRLSVWQMGILPEGAAHTGTLLAQVGSCLPSQGAGCLMEDKLSVLQNQKEKAEFVPAGFGCWVGFPPLPAPCNKSCPEVLRFCIY